MNEKVRENFVSASDKWVQLAGAKDYAEGMKKAANLIAWVHENIRSIQTHDDLRAALDSCPPLSKREEMTYLFLANHLPQAIRILLQIAAKKAADRIPPMKGGRPPAIPPQKIGEVLDNVSTLIRKGCTLEVAIYRTAQRIGKSERTIERLWARRGSISDDDLMPEVTMDEAIVFITSGGESER